MGFEGHQLIVTPRGLKAATILTSSISRRLGGDISAKGGTGFHVVSRAQTVHIWIMSGCCFTAILELGAVNPDRVHDNGELSCNGNSSASKAHAFLESQSPCLQF